MVMLHGYGSNGDDLASLVPFFENILPDTYFYSPDGIEPCELGLYGYQWFSLYDRSTSSIAKELGTKSHLVADMIKDKAKELGLGEENIILFGFSQGTMLALYLSLSSKVPYKAVLGFSGRLFLPDQIGNKTTPICLVHGLEDDVVPPKSLEEAKNELQKIGVKVETLSVEYLAHSIDLKGLQFAIDFIKLL